MTNTTNTNVLADPTWLLRFSEQRTDAGCPRCKGPLHTAEISGQRNETAIYIWCSSCSYAFTAIYILQRVVPDCINAEPVYVEGAMEQSQQRLVENNGAHLPTWELITRTPQVRPRGRADEMLDLHMLFVATASADEVAKYNAAYDRRVCAYEEQGMTRSDAQGVVDAEEMEHGMTWIVTAPVPSAHGKPSRTPDLRWAALYPTDQQRLVLNTLEIVVGFDSRPFRKDGNGPLMFYWGDALYEVHDDGTLI